MFPKALDRGPSRLGARHGLAAFGALAMTMLFQVSAGAIVADTPCNERCLADYVAAAEKCTEVKNEGARRTCNDEAHQRYVACRGDCKKTADCKELCKQLCEEIHRLCSEKCKKPACYEKCTRELGECLKKCDKECKGHAGVHHDVHPR